MKVESIVSMGKVVVDSNEELTNKLAGNSIALVDLI